MDRLFPRVSDKVAAAALGMTVERFKLAKDTLFENKKRGMMGIYCLCIFIMLSVGWVQCWFVNS